MGFRRQKELPEDIPGGERDTHDSHQDDERKREDRDPLARA
jgi:hypothetical protein